ncbi:serine hydrolase domain-containing protein [uncultured Sphingomonas sp.]|uniref:serine hydrolase domain-containing protein n=1 Tax=uncultured Sphingomonas sp. TaxID=158754 RepID=UPI0035CC444D
MRFLKTMMAGVLAMVGGIAPAQDGGELAPALAPPIMAPADRPAPVATVTPPGAAIGGSLTRTDVDAWLDGFMPYALSSGDIAGAVAVVVKDGRILTQRGYGYADLASRRPVDPERTLFRPGSVSKLITWTAVMQQVERGRIDLDADVNRYLDFRIPPRDGKPITMRQILTHTAGFEDRAKYLITYDPAQTYALDAYLKLWTPKRIFAPGTTPAYSNWATTLAGYIVQRVSGVPFDDYVERRIFRPLRMTHSSFRQPLPPKLRPFMSTGYSQASVEPKGFEFVNPAPAGSMSASGADMARFMIAHLNDGAGLMRPETARLMHRTATMSLPPLNRMALGFFETNANGRRVIGHLGDLQAFHTSLHILPGENVGIYLSVNSGGKEGAAGRVRAAFFQDFMDRYYPGGPGDGRVDPKLAAEHARMMAGNWTGSRRIETGFLRAVYGLTGQTTVSVGPKGELVIPELTDAGGAVRKWVEIAPFVWRQVGGEDRLAAQVVDGKVVRWSFDMVSPFTVFDRVPAARSATWISPLLYAGIAVLLLTFLHWPVSALVRRNYKVPLAVEGESRSVYRWLRALAGLTIAVLIGWAIAVSVLFSDLSKLGAVDALLWLLQIAGLLVFVGIVMFAAWNVALAWRHRRRWTSRLWAVLVLLAALTAMYVAVAFGLVAMTVDF